MGFRRGQWLVTTVVTLAVGLVPTERAWTAPRALTVYAAASLADAFKGLAPEFERANPGWKVTFSFAASSLLQAQISQGAPADVFAPADYAQARPLAAAKLVSEPRTFARNRLVIAVPTANPGRIRSPQDLARPGVRFVTTAPNVPIGKYTQQVLENLGRQPGARTGFAAAVNANVVSREPDVRGVLAKVELGEADAGIVYETDLRAATHSRGIAIPDRANVIAEYPVCVITTSPNRGGAEAFRAYLFSAAGRKTLKRFGFR